MVAAGGIHVRLTSPVSLRCRKRIREPSNNYKEKPLWCKEREIARTVTLAILNDPFKTWINLYNNLFFF